VDHQRPAGVAIAVRGVGNLGLPDHFAGARVEGIQLGVSGRDEHLVLIDREVACGAVRACRFRTEVVLPDQIARSPSSACTMLLVLAR
jgi:hypothetical protein